MMKLLSFFVALLTASSVFAFEGTWTFSDEVGSYKVTKYGTDDLGKIFEMSLSIDDKGYKFSNGETEKIKRIVNLGENELQSYERDFANGYFEDRKLLDFLSRKRIVEYYRIEGEDSDLDLILADGDIIVDFGGVFVLGKQLEK